MRRFPVILLVLAVALATTITIGCASSVGRTPAVETAIANDNGKVPVTTTSEDARKEFLAGRDLAEKLRITDSLQHYDKAISLDPNFASAELNRATSSPTAKEFFDHLKKAVSLSEKASKGERLFILAAEAGANGNAAKQKAHLEELVAAYPNDERAHFALGGYYFGQQEMNSAIEHYKKATELSPTYSTAFNILGYAYRQNADYANAENAFKKYIELIPGDPNPYDSYAELLLKMGRFDESIAQYRKALEIDSNFVNSHFGIAADLMYQGKHADALAELQKMMGKARNDGERRTALFGMTVVDTDNGKIDQALSEVEKQYTLGEKTNDVPNMIGDVQLRALIMLETGKYDEAKELYAKAAKMIEESNQSQAIKDNAKLFSHFNLARVAIGKNDLAAAKNEADAFQKAAAPNNPNQQKQVHSLNGMIALAEKDYNKAIAELAQANQQNPQDLYRQCQAYEGKGDGAKAKEFCKKAAEFNSLPAMNLAFVRAKAAKTSKG
ncbi:MAG TPA: tetratricopeptide repeat protein [Pyrinomonadaceae bacterium]|nr:tetratricopeptide repeat protein [Pyrinomonadaceae bacterium]